MDNMKVQSYFAITQSIKFNVDFPKHKTVDLNEGHVLVWVKWISLGDATKKVEEYKITDSCSYLSHVTTSIFLVMMSKGEKLK